MSSSVADFVKKTIINSRLLNNQAFVDVGSSMWNCFSEQQYTMMKHLIDNPLMFDPRLYPSILTYVGQYSAENEEQKLLSSVLYIRHATLSAKRLYDCLR